MSRCIIALVGALGYAAGCESQPPTAAQLEQGPLAFLHDGQTTKEDVLLKLGVPTAQFEGERILTYRLVADAQGMHVVGREHVKAGQDSSSHEIAEYSLVLVFEGNALGRHSLVPDR